ncbi:MAG: hypothetical protein ACRCTQ_07030 [Brevinemataceae bacterium]
MKKIKMKKYILLLLIILVSPMMAQENKQAIGNFPYVNNTFKMYVALGLPIGVGFLYAPEFRSSINNNILHVLNFDVKFVGVNMSAVGLDLLGFDVGIQYSVGTILASGARFYVDLIGVGISYGFHEHSGQLLQINILGFQSTSANGFYIALRSYVSLARRAKNYPIKPSFAAYLAIGYDFGKKINPKDYESRMR